MRRRGGRKSGNSEGGCDAVGEGYEGHELTRGREDKKSRATGVGLVLRYAVVGNLVGGG